MISSSDITYGVLNSINLARMSFPGGDNIDDILNFGFSYIESEDNFVSYVIGNSKVMKRIFGEMPESILEPTKEHLGKLWTASLIFSKKVKDNHIIFSNLDYSTVLVLTYKG